MWLRATLRLLSPAMLLLALSCGTDDGPAVQGPGAPVPESPGPDRPAGPLSVVVSNAIGSAVPGPGAATSHATARLTIDGPVVYVSLLPGAVPHGATLTVRNMVNGAEVTAAIIDGGVDPVRIAAAEGNGLRIVAKDSVGASYTHVAQVKQRARPRLVRTSPTPARTDVPLNTIIRVVFSEPVDLSTAQSNVQLLQNGVPVAGSVRAVSGNPEVITFVPDSPLAPGTSYTLDVAAGVQDQDGDPLMAAASATFTTSPAPPTVGVARLRVVHAVAAVGEMDVRIDGTEVVSNLPYLGASQYLDVASARHRILFQVGSGTMLDFSGTLAAGADYTALPCCALMPNGQVLLDDNSEPPAGQARLRFVDYASISSSVRIYLTAPGADLTSAVPIPVNVTWATDYLTVPAGDYQIRITPFDSDVVAIDSGPVTFLSGQVRTIVAVNAATGGAPFDVLILRDRD